MSEILNAGTKLETVDSLTPHPRNPNQGDVGAISESIEAHGFYGTVIAQKSTRTILAGEHRWRAAVAQGMAKIPVTWVDVDDDQALRIVLVDNRSGELAFRDPAGLAALLEELARTPEGLTGTGYDGDALDELLADLKPKPSIGHDEVSDPPENPITQAGDLWTLGEHRLLCGNATTPDDYALVLDGDLADCVWTDPPYGVGYVGKTKKALTIANDGIDDDQLYRLLAPAFDNTLASCAPGAPWYVAAPPGPVFAVFARALGERGIWRQTLVWLKDVFVLGHSDYHYRHESIVYGWNPAGAHYFGGDRTLDTVWEIPRPTVSTEHPTMKPVELVARALRNSTKPGDTVLDPFGGSGTTLVAAYSEGRVARLIELDAAYCDVICARYQNLTGTKPTRDGEPYDFLGR